MASEPGKALLPRRVLAAAVGCGRFASVIGSGALCERLAAGNKAVALIGDVLGFVVAEVEGALAGSAVATRLFPDAPA